MATLAYNAFVSNVAKGRGVSVETIRSEEWGRGAILDAAEGARVGLVDGVQGFDETVVQMAQAIRIGKATAAATRASAGTSSEDGLGRFELAAEAVAEARSVDAYVAVWRQRLV